MLRLMKLWMHLLRSLNAAAWLRRAWRKKPDGREVGVARGGTEDIDIAIDREVARDVGTDHEVEKDIDIGEEMTESGVEVLRNMSGDIEAEARIGTGGGQKAITADDTRITAHEEADLQMCETMIGGTETLRDVDDLERLWKILYVCEQAYHQSRPEMVTEVAIIGCAFA
jgi:hypothetical protein